jgi:Trypsin-co-occurring domain 1
MGYVVEIPVEGGGVLRVQGSEEDPPDGLVPATRSSRETVVVRTRKTVQDALAEIKPAITATTTMLRAMAPDELTIEFGLLLGAEGSAIVTKGKAEVHFTVTLSWKQGDPQPGSDPPVAAIPLRAADADGGQQESRAGGDQAALAGEAVPHA